MNLRSKTHSKQCSSVALPSGKVPTQQWPTRNSRGRKSGVVRCCGLGNSQRAENAARSVSPVESRMPAIWGRPAPSLDDLLPHLVQQRCAVGRSRPQELGGAGERRSTEVPHQVRLIRVSGGRGQSRPFHGGALSQSRQRPDEPLETSVRLGGQ